MATSPYLVEGFRQEAFVKAEATYDTQQAMAATDAVSPIKGTLKLEPSYAFEESKEAAGTATLVSEIAGMKGGKWSGSFYVKPNSSVGTAPDIGPLLTAALGTETVVGATSVTYTLSDTARGSLQVVRHVDDKQQEVATGAWVEEMSVEAVGGQAPTLSFSGGYATHGWAFADDVGVGNIAYNATSLPLNDASRGCLGANGRIQFSTPVDDGGVAGTVLCATAQTYNFSGAGSETLTIKVDGGATQTVTFADGAFANPAAATAAEVVAAINTGTTGCTAAVDSTKVRITSDTVGSTSSIQVTGGTANSILNFSTDAVAGTAGSGYLVTATVDTSGAATATLSPAVVSLAGHAAGTAFVPWMPSTRTEAGTVLGGVGCDLTIDGVTLGFISAKISIKTGIHGLDKEATATKPNRLAGSDRRVTGEIQCYLLGSATGNANLIGRAWQAATHDIALRVGSATAGAHMHINVDEARIEVAPVEIPEAEEAVFTLKFIARKDTNAADEINFVFD